MVYKIDYLDDVYEWSITPDGPEYKRVSDYTPTLYAVSDRRNNSDESLLALRETFEYYPAVASTEIEQWRRGFRYEREDILRIDVLGLTTFFQSPTGFVISVNQARTSASMSISHGSSGTASIRLQLSAHQRWRSRSNHLRWRIHRSLNSRSIAKN